MYIHVKVIADAKQEFVERLKKDHLTVSVKKPATQNLANRRARELVAMHLSLPVGKVRLISGHHTPSKIFSVEE